MNTSPTFRHRQKNRQFKELLYKKESRTMYDEQRAKKQLDWLKKRKKDVDKRERVKNKDINDRRKAA